MKFPEKRGELKPLVDQAILHYIETHPTSHIQPSDLQEAVLAAVPVTFPAADRLYFEQKFARWIKQRWAARRKVDSETSDEGTWFWIPRRTEADRVTYGYYVPAELVSDAELREFVTWTTRMSERWQAHGDYATDLLKARVTTKKTPKRVVVALT